MKTQRQLIAELRGGLCRCGAAKQPRQTFCRSCYFTLPAKMRSALYRRIGEGYEQAYQAAADHLDQHKGKPR